MSPKVTRLPKKAHARGFGERYSRVRRDTDGPSPDNIPEEERRYYSAESPGFVYVAVPHAPVDGAVLLGDLPAQNALALRNPLLLYRFLQSLYGEPEILGGRIDPESSKMFGMTSDWGFCLEIDPGLLVEIRSLYENSRTTFRVWAQDASNLPAIRARAGDAVAQFLGELDDTLAQNRHLFNEQEDLEAARSQIPDNVPRSWVVNIAAERYRAALSLWDLAREHESGRDGLTLDPGERLRVDSEGAILLSATTFFLVSLEAFVNTLYTLLLKPDFDENAYERIVSGGDLDLRILSLHAFCDGFRQQAIRTDTATWRTLMWLREFRNDIVHGNITMEHEVHLIPERPFVFYYHPGGDSRAGEGPARKDDYLPRNMSCISDGVVQRVKDAVDEVRDEIISAMDEATRAWVEGWAGDHVIPRRVADE